MDAGSGTRKKHSRPRIRPQGVPGWAYAAAAGCLALAFGYVAFAPLVQDRDAEALAGGQDAGDCGGLPFLCSGGPPLGAAPPQGPLGSSGGFTPDPRLAAPSPPASPTSRPPAPAPSPTKARVSPPPSKAPAVVQIFASDLPFDHQENGFGRVERDTSNGEKAAGDGGTIQINGVDFDKGLGVHAPSDVGFRLNGACRRFTASIGIDDEKDEVDGDGNVVFRVVADGAAVFQSRPVDFTDDPIPINVDVTNARVVSLVVDPAGSDRSDHADWANARFDCSRRP